MSIPTLRSADPRVGAISERCDRCGARAKVRAVLPSTAELYLCGHHGRQHWSALVRHGADFQPAVTG